MTGARERLVRAAVSLKSAYTDAELSKPFVFPRVTTDTDKLLADESTRHLAVEKMSGKVQSIFGPGASASGEPLDVTPEREALPEPEPVAEAVVVGEPVENDDPFSVDNPVAEVPEQDPRVELKRVLEEYLIDDNYPLKASAKDVVRTCLDNETITEQALRDVIQRCKDYRTEKYGEGAA